MTRCASSAAASASAAASVARRLVLTGVLLLTAAIHEAPTTATADMVGMLRKVRDRTGGSWTPEGVVDVGANAGAWSKQARSVFPDAKILMVEATPKHEPSLRRAAEEMGSAEYRIAVCTAAEGEKVQYYQGKDTGNSLFRENSKHYENDAPVARVSATVDALVRSSDLLRGVPVDVVKADVQGAELLVLQGATAVLDGATFVYLEASTVEYNRGAPCFYEVDAYLRSRGYYLYDIAGLNYNIAFKTLGLGQYDAMYVRPDSPRLPPALRDLGGTFCGHGRNPPGGGAAGGSAFVASSPRGFAAGLVIGFLLASLAFRIRVHWGGAAKAPSRRA